MSKPNWPHQRCVSHVAGIFFCLAARQPRLCFVLPTAALRQQCKNRTLPAGRIHQVGRSSFEPVTVAMLREYREETGGTSDCVERLSGIGAPFTHKTGLGQDKFIQGFAGIVSEMHNCPRFRDEIAQVDWLPRDDWAETIATMNRGKQLLVYELLSGFCELSRMPENLKRHVRGFLQQPQLLAA